MPPSDLTPSQALDVLESEEVILDTEVSLSGHVTASERSDNDDNDDDNDMVSI